MDDRAASRTAVLVCEGRAVAHGRIARGRFDDPTAMALLRQPERAAVERARTGEPPPALAERIEFEMLRASAEVMAPRTVAIDDAVRARPTPQVVILGAGLDGRAWRMPELAGVVVFEVDHPASQQDKRDRARDLTPVADSLRFVPVDFTRDPLGAALTSTGHHETMATTWVWEGVVPYLSGAEVEATVDVVCRRSAPGSRVVVNYQAPNVAATVGRVAARAMTVVSRAPSVFAGEPRRSTWKPAAMRRLLEGRGWAVHADDDLLGLSEQLGIEVQNRRSLRAGRVAVADR